jgi:hypothetical protein
LLAGWGIGGKGVVGGWESVHLSFPTGPELESVEARTVGLHDRLDLLSLTDLVVEVEVPVQVGLQGFISDESHSTVAALELHSFVNLTNGHHVQSKIIKVHSLTP